MNSLQDLFGTMDIRLSQPVFTAKQALTKDKRCGIYVLNAMNRLTEHLLHQAELPTMKIVNDIISASHQELHLPEVIAAAPCELSQPQFIPGETDAGLMEFDFDETGYDHTSPSLVSPNTRLREIGTLNTEDLDDADALQADQHSRAATPVKE